MKSVRAGAACLAAALFCAGGDGGAQDAPPRTGPADPRVGLKAGVRDAGVAAASMEVVASLPRPPGFFDPRAPAGPPTPPERDPKVEKAAETRARQLERAGEAVPDPPGSDALNLANSDLAFSGSHVFVGSFHGFNVYDVADASNPRHVVSVVCPGGQGDLSVHGHLLFMSVEQTRGRLDCGLGGVNAAASAERFRGIRIFDISNLRAPRQVAAVQTCRGSHTHTLVADPDEPDHVYIYASGTSRVRPGRELTGCSALDPQEDPDTALFSIDVIRVPLAAPERAAIVSRPRIFADPATGSISGLWPGGDHGPGTQKSSVTNQCHDITVFPQVGLAAGACSGNGILLDISDPVNPKRLDQVVDPNFAYWHSATFNHDGTKVVFTDEWGGGMRPRCRATDPPTWGGNAIFDVVDRTLRFASYYKLPAPQTAQENCVAHNGSIVPVPGRDIMVQAWYQGGISVFDFTDSVHPFEVAYFDRGPLDARRLITGGYWSAYWYNGHVFGTEIARGLDVFRLTPGAHLSRHEIDAAAAVQVEVFNAQHQRQVSWPAAPVVARAYLDQLTRSGGIGSERAGEVDAALDAAGQVASGREDAAGLRDRLDALAARLDHEASAAGDRDARRLRALAAVLRGRQI
jgi:hypothetical protein